MGAGVSEVDLEQIPRLDPDFDPTKQSFTPAEGFLLSRIDGQTPWRLLREIGGLTPDGVDERIVGWIARGVLLADKPESAT